MNPRNQDREVSTRDAEDREADEFSSFEEYRDPNNLDYMTPQPRAGEHLRWVATGQKNVSKERARIMSGYVPVKYEDFPDHRPFKNLLAASVVQPGDVVSNGHDLTLMRTSLRYVASRTAHMARQSRDLVRSAHDQVPRQEPGGVLLDDSDPDLRKLRAQTGVSPETTVERRRSGRRDVSFGSA